MPIQSTNGIYFLEHRHLMVSGNTIVNYNLSISTAFISPTLSLRSISSITSLGIHSIKN
ncbi:hypothetical protein D3C71_237010 [compost metagenome]